MDVHVRLEVARRREGLLADLALVGFLLKESGKEDISTKYTNKLVWVLSTFQIHALWFIRNTVKFSICLFPIFSKNGYMIVAYLLLNFLVNLSMVFLSNSSHSGCIRTSQEVCGT